MTTNEWIIDTLAPGEVSVQSLDFVSYDPLKELPEVLLRMDAQEQDRLFRQPIEPPDFNGCRRCIYCNRQWYMGFLLYPQLW